eukprot:TRINITY_DN12430_c0_g2_i5.p2 TRINITY_DN12430_c0_g2~~TRINITY_DN12430_c0_g2_i5.p2  ORF type:complete len:222 (+),score=39.46 TRINITY_DN12430_c0_g2_i5:117-782(+)
MQLRARLKLHQPPVRPRTRMQIHTRLKCTAAYLPALICAAGDWYPWGIYRAGNGDIGVFIAAFRHVVTLFRSVGTPAYYQLSYNNKNANGITTPLAIFYPGDEYVDQVCVSVYNFATTTSSKSFGSLFADTYYQLTSITRKPLCIAEMGSTGYYGDKTDWITAAWDALAIGFVNVTTVNWFPENQYYTTPEQDLDFNTPDEVNAWVNGYRYFQSVTAPTGQ